MFPSCLFISFASTWQIRLTECNNRAHAQEKPETNSPKTPDANHPCQFTDINNGSFPREHPFLDASVSSTDASAIPWDGVANGGIPSPLITFV